MFIGSSDVVHGKPTTGHIIPFDIEKYHTKETRICRLYFDKQSFPAPQQLSEGGSNATFGELRHSIRYVASREGSPVVCNGGNSERDHCKKFTCSNKYKSKEGQKKKMSLLISSSMGLQWILYPPSSSRDIHSQLWISMALL